MPRLKEEYSYISTPPLGLHGLFYIELYLQPLKARADSVAPPAMLLFPTAGNYKAVCRYPRFTYSTHHDCVNPETCWAKV